MTLDVGAELRQALRDGRTDYTVRGIVAGNGEVFPIGTDTKVLSTIFEAFTRPLVYDIAGRHGLEVWEAKAQNSYPDFTLMRSRSDTEKIAIDVKTTYRDRPGQQGTEATRSKVDRSSVVSAHSLVCHVMIEAGSDMSCQLQARLAVA